MLRYLKYLRWIIAIFFFLTLFLAMLGITVPFLALTTKVQFIPSLLTFITLFSLPIFLFILIFTLLIGRIYCSALCPLGIFQDLISRISRFFRKKKIFHYSKEKTIIRNSFLSFCIILFIIAGTISLIFFDPYSIFGKIVSGFFRPLYIFINDNITRLFDPLHKYLNTIGYKNFSHLSFWVGFSFLITIGLFSYKRGRLFCNTICPVGTLLGIVSRFSFFKIQFNKNKCTRCGKCSTVCKSECIDIRNQTIDFDRCVACYNCLSVCPENGLNYKSTFKMIKKKKMEINQETPFNNERRTFLTYLIAGIAGSSILASLRGQDKENGFIPNTIKIKKNHPITPPGSQSLSHLMSKCTACQLCISQCPTHVLKPSLKEYGLSGFMMPIMNYSQSFCNYECTHCTEVCPTGALLPVSVEEKKTLQIGKVVFIKENCIVALSETSCGACAEHCPTAAVHMVPYKGNLRIPETNESICIGCGACEYACPAIPNKAIYVEGNPTHLKAIKPEEKPIEIQVPEEFPF